MAAAAVTGILDVALRCASRRCGVTVHSFDADDFVGVFSCTRCGSRMWAVRLEVGDVKIGLSQKFSDVHVVNTLIARYHLPGALERAQWLAVWISNDDYRQYRTDLSPDPRQRSRNLISRIARQ